MPTMPYQQKRILLSLLALLFIFTAYVWGRLLPPSQQLLTTLTPTSTSNERVAALLAANAATTTAAFPEPEKTFDCHIQGALPDPACTPGAIFPDATPEEICVPGYTKEVRSVSTKLKKYIYGAYGIAYPQPTGSYEMDHLIPLALGGSNDAANLFPEARDPGPGFKEKDVVEVYMYEQMCAGKIPLAAAQIQIAKDWVAVYQALNPDDIANLKAKYRSWSN